MQNGGERYTRQPNRNVNRTSWTRSKGREKKLMEKQTICTNDANTNENIYYFIHVWHATANKLWQNFMGENITAAVGAKQKCESTSFLCVFPKETVPEKWQRRGEMNKHKARITPIWSQANKYGWWRWNLLIKVEQSSNNWNGSITSIEPIQKKKWLKAWQKHWSRISILILKFTTVKIEK